MFLQNLLAWSLFYLLIPDFRARYTKDLYETFPSSPSCPCCAGWGRIRINQNRHCFRQGAAATLLKQLEATLYLKKFTGFSVLLSSNKEKGKEKKEWKKCVSWLFAVTPFEFVSFRASLQGRDPEGREAKSKRQLYTALLYRCEQPCLSKANYAAAAGHLKCIWTSCQSKI